MTNSRKGTAVKKTLMSSALISLSALAAAQAQAATGSGSMSAIILTPIVVSGTVDLHFGSMTQTGAGTMLIDTTGARTPSAAVTAVTGAGLESQGVLSVTAATGLAIDLSMTAATFTVDDTGAGAPMNVNAFQLVTNAGGTAETITLAASPSTFPLGATLNLAAAQVAGTYTGTYNVNANYQ
ncbi:MAG: DUF4402 domain-containing protein [Alphaproteobacteria bacterium]|nr:DUF4402 domain-containing protein [Alphaproteobacteria bacterium]